MVSTRPSYPTETSHGLQANLLGSFLVILLLATLTSTAPAGASETDLLVSTNARPGAFPLVAEDVADLVADADDAMVVGIVSRLLAEDVERVTGRKPRVVASPQGTSKQVVIIGTLGKNRFIDELIQSGKLDVSHIQGKWESYVIARIAQPFSGVDQALVIAGSDRRGTAYGVFTLSEAIGVSPWHFWADVPTPRKEHIYLSNATVVQGPPAVRYRGIFINDEDWGLQPWAARHMDTDIKDIGPKTYAQVFELLLRLKANYIWPAMHPCTKAFNIYPENKRVADDYAIVMGATHCEPMLCNNVTEWHPETMGDWNYETNRDTIYRYWQQRAKDNGRFENVYTVGMRGIHDSGMPGGGTLDDKCNRLGRVIADQRKILAEYVNPDPAQVPQIFCPYKEVLDIYKRGLKLPDDVTIVWPDDNYGYIRHLSDPTERGRTGGSGVYYHLSYWGDPRDYLWISSTSPAKIAYEMNKAYAYGADRLWVFNVGDIKPSEMETTFALQLAYNPNRWPAEKAMDFLEQWADQTFGEQHARDIAGVFRTYYRLVQQAKPEHIDRVTFSEKEQDRRLAEFQVISQKAEAIYASLDPEYRDAFFELVLYPIKCADLMNQKQTSALRGDADRARSAYDEIQELTRHYNKEVAGGKWDGIMDASPRSLSVFRRPDAASIRDAEANARPLMELPIATAECSGQMELTTDGIRAVSPDLQPEDTKSTARFLFDAKEAGKADLYFLARCPDAKQDSWYVSFNGQRTVSNDQPTGADLKWLKVMEVELRQGRNELVVAQREPRTLLNRVVFMLPGNVPRQTVTDPDFVFAASDRQSAADTPTSHWQEIAGLGIEASAMTLTPYETPSIPDADFAKAPSITYAFTSEAVRCDVEVRFLPTHAINEGMGLRYAVTVDGGPVEVFDINAPEYSGNWAGNVLNGFSKGRTSHELKPTADHKVTVHLLDPGIVLSQIRVSTAK